MTDSNESQTTNRRSLLNTIAAGALATVAVTGTVSADRTTADGSGATARYCETHRDEYRCVDADCDCCSCDCDCKSKRQKRSCCIDPYGTVVSCGQWIDTGDCCTSC